MSYDQESFDLTESPPSIDSSLSERGSQKHLAESPVFHEQLAPRYLAEQARHMQTMSNGLFNSIQPFRQDHALLCHDPVQDAFFNAMPKKRPRTLLNPAMEYPSYQPVFPLQTRPEIDPAFEEWQRRQSATSARIYRDNFSSFGPQHEGMFYQMETTKTHQVIHFIRFSILHSM
jgi:hypothetical protein